MLTCGVGARVLDIVGFIASFIMCMPVSIIGYRSSVMPSDIVTLLGIRLKTLS
jgi:hypothetical protein